jgi:hypothetical protein
MGPIRIALSGSWTNLKHTRNPDLVTVVLHTTALLGNRWELTSDLRSLSSRLRFYFTSNLKHLTSNIQRVSALLLLFLCLVRPYRHDLTK